MKVRQDTLLRLETSILLVVAIAIVLPLWLAVLLSVSLCVGKELWDMHNGEICFWYDILCNMVGVIVGLLLTIFIRYGTW